MLNYEQLIICGVDEAGRGPLAGSVFASAVILNNKISIPDKVLLQDSKKISAKNRQIAFDWIIENSSYSIQQASVVEIEELNILQASLLAMQRAINNLHLNNCYYDIILVDGKQIPQNLPNNIKAQAIIGGDNLISSISAASILAKVSRDNYMLELDKIYPQYDFKTHKGYPTKNHIANINKHGICPEHRKTFSPVKNLII